MKREDLQVVNELLVKIDEYTKELKRLNYVLSEEFVERKSYLNYMNTSELSHTIGIPKNFQKLIAKMLHSHYTVQIASMEGKIDNLLS